MTITSEDSELAKTTIEAFSNYKYVTTPRELTDLCTRFYEAYWRRDESVLELQIYFIGRDEYREWDHLPFATSLYERLLPALRLSLYRDRLLVEFVPEVNGWYIRAQVPEHRQLDMEELARIVDGGF